MKDLLTKLKNGDPISDDELEMLIDHYSILTERLRPHGELFQLVLSACYRDLEQLRSYKRARLQNKFPKLDTND